MILYIVLSIEFLGDLIDDELDEELKIEPILAVFYNDL